MTQDLRTYSLLGDITSVPHDYIREVAWTKRVLERWSVDPAFRDDFAADDTAALEAIGAPLRPGQIRPFVDGFESEDGLPVSARRYQAFIREKRDLRRRISVTGEAADPRMAAWRRRQLYRCTGELGLARADAIVHAPAAFELSKGCTVGCWFCGVAAPKFDHTWPYTEDNATLWRGTLSTMRGLIGDALQNAFLYWATDPLDNPEYEEFLKDFHALVGRCPQTTTALGPKDVERTRQLLKLTRSLGSDIDRFSIIAVNSLNRLHEALSAEEMLRVECVPQNRGAAKPYRKSNAGRARKFAQKRGAELVKPEATSTIACVSGFLFNMLDRTVQLVTPCNASDRWPLGYWVLDRAHFSGAAELGEVIEGMIARNMRTRLRLTDPVRLRRDVRLTRADGGLEATAAGQHFTVRDQPDLDDLAACLTAEEPLTAAAFAARRRDRSGVPQEHTFAWLNHLFEHGLTDEEPEPARAEPVSVPLGLPRSAAR